MKCPFCGHTDTRVLDSRPTEDGTAIRRRRECPSCGARFTTYERYDLGPSWVVKKDGRREKFNREKILSGVMKACEKRPVPYEKIEKLVNSVILRLQKLGKKEVDTGTIGEMVMDGLKELDQVAYVRFASVYRDFREIDQFLDIIHELKRMGRGPDEKRVEKGLPDEGRIRETQERTGNAQEQADVRDIREDKGSQGAG